MISRAWHRRGTGALFSAAIGTLLFAACAPSIEIGPEPARADHLENQGVAAIGYPIEYSPLGFKVIIAVPQGGHLCIVVPASARDPVECLGVDVEAIGDALPKGEDAPFGLAIARTGEVRYLVMLSPISEETVTTREAIDKFVDEAAGAFEAGPSADDGEEPPAAPTPKYEVKLSSNVEGSRYEIVTKNNVPQVRFRADVAYPKDHPQHDSATSFFAAAFAGRGALVSVLTSPEDAPSVAPYAEATFDAIVMPPRADIASFGKSKKELERGDLIRLLAIGGPLIAFGIIAFWVFTGKKKKPAA